LCGKERAFQVLKQIYFNKKINRLSLSMFDLFRVFTKLTNSSLTVDLMMLFYSFGVNIIELKTISKFLTRGTTFYQTSLYILNNIISILNKL
jgi:hypothetical protein